MRWHGWMIGLGLGVALFAASILGLLLPGCNNSGRGGGVGVSPQDDDKMKLNRGLGTHQAHDFSDAFYLQEGLDPDNVIHRHGRPGDPETANAVDTETDVPTRSDRRILAINIGYDAAGAFFSYPDPPGFLNPDAFLDNEAGDKAREIADRFRAFIFPQRDGIRLSPAPPNRRQDNLFDTTMGYLTHNPLGLWRLVFVRYSDDAFDACTSKDGCPEDSLLAELAERNGTDLDGTPVIKRLHELLALEEAGDVVFELRDEEGGPPPGGPPWVV